MNKYVFVSLNEEEWKLKPEQVLAGRPWLAEFTVEQFGYFIQETHQMSGPQPSLYSSIRGTRIPWGLDVKLENAEITIDCTSLPYHAIRCMVTEVIDDVSAGPIYLMRLDSASYAQNLRNDLTKDNFHRVEQLNQNRPKNLPPTDVVFKIMMARSQQIIAGESDD